MRKRNPIMIEKRFSANLIVKNIFLLLLCTMFLQLTALQAQDINIFKTEGAEQYKIPENIVYTQPVKKKRFWRATGELALVQLLPWAYNRYIRKAEFAKVSFESIGDNLNFSNWKWDDNNFKTNQFAHPYHGNLYFNAFRTNGYSFWQSVPAAFAGSFIWEVAGETHPAAPNDLINTSLGGIALGEMTYRLSKAIFRKRRKAKSATMTEIYSFMVNPLSGLNRILDGQWGKPYPIEEGEYIPLSVVIDAGLRRSSLNSQDLITKGNSEFFTRFNLQYGNPFKDFGKPFRNFSVVAEIGASDSARLNTLTVDGSLYGTLLSRSEKVSNFFYVTMNYDYYNNTALNYGSQSINTKFISNIMASSKWQFRLRAGLGWTVLSATPNKYLYFGEGRDYDFGTGMNFSGGVGIKYGNSIFFSSTYRGGLTKTINGAESNYFLQNMSNELRIVLLKNFSINGEWGFFRLKANYKDFPDVQDKFFFSRIALGYRSTL